MNLRTVQFVTPTITYRGGMDISTMLCMSPCSSDFIIDLLRHRRIVWRKVSEDFAPPDAIFPADCPHLPDCHCHRLRGEYWRIHRVSQHIARFVDGTTVVRSIVTAAVYRGFASELRLAAVPSG